jgi:hypothetical protein
LAERPLSVQLPTSAGVSGNAKDAPKADASRIGRRRLRKIAEKNEFIEGRSDQRKSTLTGNG